jgi:hypothetical protein
MKKPGLTKAAKQATVNKWADWILRMRKAAKDHEPSSVNSSRAGRDPLDGGRDYRIGEYGAAL